MMQIDDLLQKIVSPNVRAALQFWEQSRGEKELPSRSEINLIEIPSLLLGLTLVDVINAGQDYRLRYVGRNIINNQVLKIGQLQSEMPEQQGQTMIKKRYNRVVEERRPVFQRYVYISIQGDKRLIEAVSCPLSDDGETINKLFCYGEDLGFAGSSEKFGDTLM
tara:strand:+ start:65 stop:556 length:492 start_codon:yes stop_codon:yes gene_type:complete